MQPYIWGLLGLVVGLLALWCWQKIQVRIQRWRFGDVAHHQELLARFSQQMVNRIEDREAIAPLFGQEIPQALGIARASILFTDEQMQDGKLLTDAVDLQIPINNAAVRRVAAGGRAVRIAGELRRIVSQGRTDLSWARVWVPLLRGTKLYGLWLLGDRSNGRECSPLHLEWMTTYARQAAMILEAVEHAQHEQSIAREMQALYHQTVRAREMERNHLARELHDGVLQDMCRIARDLKALAKETIGTGAQRDNIAPNPLIVSANESIQTLRSICYDLRPPFLENHLLSAIKILSERIEAHADTPISVETSADIDKVAFSDDSIVAIYRIVQEALNNAVAYADASEITVRLIKYPDKLRVTISDDGKGIKHSDQLAQYVAKGHLGLVGMRERATMIGGNVEIHSAKDYGTVITLDAPYTPTAE